VPNPGSKELFEKEEISGLEELENFLGRKERRKIF
jgi:hypothetical protein